MKKRAKTILFYMTLAIAMPIGFGVVIGLGCLMVIAPFFLLVETITNLSYEVVAADVAYILVGAGLIWWRKNRPAEPLEPENKHYRI